MEKEIITKAQDMGLHTSQIFSGEYKYEATRLMYAETADLFASEMKKHLPDTKPIYKIADVGSFRGELMEKIINKLPQYHFYVIAIDVNEEALSKNKVANEKILASAESLPLDEGSVDIAIMRYLLQWNIKEKQQMILRELARIIRSYALVEHAGSGSEDPEGWRQKLDEIYDGVSIPKLKRGEHFCASREEIEEWMRKGDVSFVCLRDRRIQNKMDFYAERYDLTPEELELARKILGDKNYTDQIDWLLFPSGSVKKIGF